MTRAHCHVETGTYTGNGTSSREIATAHAPDVIFTKRINGTDTAMVMRWGRRMPRNTSEALAISSGTAQTNQIVEGTNDGFIIGSGQNQNTALYAYVALSFGPARHLWQDGVYTGTAADNRDVRGDYVGCSFTPDLLAIARITVGAQVFFRTSAHSGDSSQSLSGAGAANAIQAFYDDGFQLGSSSAVNSAVDHYWLALAEHPGMVIGSYTGTGVAQSVSVGWQPTAVIVKAIGAADAAMFLSQGMVDSTIDSIPLSAAAADANGIASLDASGFSVGTAAGANANGVTYWYMALRDGSYDANWTRTAV